MKEILLRFKRQGTMAVIGEMVDLDLMNCVNSKVWKGREPETCKLVQFHQARPVFQSESTDFFFTVCYRPPDMAKPDEGRNMWEGLWSEGWKIKHIKINKEGALLDAEGKPLPKGEPPLIVESSLYKTVDYNLFDFGDAVT